MKAVEDRDPLDEAFEAFCAQEEAKEAASSNGSLVWGWVLCGAIIVVRRLSDKYLA